MLALLPLAGQRARARERDRARVRAVRRRHDPHAPICRRRCVRHANRTAAGRDHRHAAVGQTLDEYIREQERRYIDETIKFNGGSREKAAKMLGISMATLYRKLEVKTEQA